MHRVEQAEQTILGLVQPFVAEQDREVVDLLMAAERILAQPVMGQLDIPHWDNSAMDGYAVRSADVQASSAEQPVVLEVVETIPAGYQPQRKIQAGQAARILTGSMMPAGADTVVMQEDTQREGDRVSILTAPPPNAFVRHQGHFYRAGAPLLTAGLRLQAPEIAVLAAAQCAQVPVFRRPRVAILSTGDELVSIHTTLQPGQIVDSNQYALAVAVTQAGAEPIRLGVVPDEPAAIQDAIAQAATTADVILSSGGVSVGDYDYVDRILEQLGADIHIRSVAVKPGKPLTVATLQPAQRSVLYFGLPGNPVSALVSFWRFVLPALRKLSGQAEPWTPPLIQARTQHELRSDGKRESYLWGRWQLSSTGYEFELAGGSHSSGNLINLAGCNALAVVPLGQTHYPVGSIVQVMQVG